MLKGITDKLVREKISLYKKETGLSYSKWSREAGLNVNYLTQYMKNEAQTMSLSVLEALLAYINKSPLEFLGQDTDGLYTLEKAETKAVPVIGEVQAGVWTEALQFEDEAQDFAPVDQALLDKWNFKNLYGLRVVGDSMNKVFMEGGIVFIASAYEADINSGDYVVVQRIRGGEYEATVKRMVIDEDAKVAYLQPESTNPKYTPIQIPWPHIGNSFPVVGQDIDRIEVVGKVVTYLAPYPNFVG
jgi:SOS-response transcriptional repressor LexA